MTNPVTSNCSLEQLFHIPLETKAAYSESILAKDGTMVLSNDIQDMNSTLISTFSKKTTLSKFERDLLFIGLGVFICFMGIQAYRKFVIKKKRKEN